MGGKRSLRMYLVDMESSTNRLLIRSFDKSDIRPYALIVGDERVMKYLGDGKAQDFDTAKAYVEGCISREKADGVSRFAVVWKETGQLIGFSGFKMMSGVVDFGYRFSAEFWGRGIATEAGLSVLEHGTQELGMEAITGRIVRGNSASAAVLSKLGFRPWHSPPFEDARHDWFLLHR